MAPIKKNKKKWEANGIPNDVANSSVKANGLL